MLLVIFLVSILVLEGILHHDAVVLRKSEPPKPLPEEPRTINHHSDVLNLAEAIEQHGRGAKVEEETDDVSRKARIPVVTSRRGS